ncbi:MAG: ornithine carbamoyltransferase [Acidobacteria bacterium]|nr:ornithine carbamoyltransferase [Acidobacteriota bacterium]
MHKYANAIAAGETHFLSMAQLTPAELFDLLAQAQSFRDRNACSGVLNGKSLALIFEKPSLRTRVTFEVAIRQLGGWPILLDGAESKLGERESVPDLGRNLSQWVDGIIARVFSHDSLEELATYASIPVINALSDREHPCQALADLLTLYEVWGSFRGKQLVYVGDWNNVSRSLAEAARLAGLRFRAVCPEGYGPAPDEDVEWSQDVRSIRGGDAIYTDVWTSMGQEAEAESRAEIFRPYQVNQALMSKTGKPALFMHCLPAHRGLEVTDSVIDSDYSLVFQQAANRLPVEKAILVNYLEKKA